MMEDCEHAQGGDEQVDIPLGLGKDHLDDLELLPVGHEQQGRDGEHPPDQQEKQAEQEQKPVTAVKFEVGANVGPEVTDHRTKTGRY